MNPNKVINLNADEFGSYIHLLRDAEAREGRVSGAAHYRKLRLAVRGELEPLFDRIIEDARPDYRLYRLYSNSVMIESDAALVTVTSAQKATYVTFSFEVYGRSVVAAEAYLDRVRKLFADTTVTDKMFTIQWLFHGGPRGTMNVSIEEMADDVLHDSAYPVLAGGVDAFVERFLKSSEPILILQGPPGTGKTRLIRYILGTMTRKRDHATAIYTGDMKLLESDDIFVRFITNDDDAFVIEDADHILEPRSKGNEHLHRFLTITDGVVRAAGRKVILSTNLPNIGDLDDALIRPGRCFSHVFLRTLTADEAALVAADLGDVGQIMKHLGDRQRVTLADIYKAANE